MVWLCVKNITRSLIISQQESNSKNTIISKYLYLKSVYIENTIMSESFWFMNLSTMVVLLVLSMCLDSIQLYHQ